MPNINPKLPIKHTYDSKIVKTDMLIQAKQGQVKIWMEMANMSHDVGDSATAANSMASPKSLLVEISGLVKELSKLKNAACAQVSVEVKAFLEKGRTSIGVVGPAAKKQKADNLGGAAERTCQHNRLLPQRRRRTIK